MIRAVCGDPYREKLFKIEQDKVDVRMDDYYEAKWSSVIMSIMQYRSPLVANAHALTSISASVDPSHKMYFHIDWVRPGKHIFVVEHDKGGKILDEEDEEIKYEKRWQSFLNDKLVKGKKNE